MSEYLYIGLAGLGIVTASFFIRKIFFKLNLLKVKRGTKDTVVVRQFSRGPWAPSLSPFPMKLETYLRMANIPYENDLSSTMSPKGKIPWISYNEDDISDSQFSIEYINKKMDVDLNSHLTQEEKAIAMAFRKLVEDDLYWCLAAHRWKYGDTNYLAKVLGIPKPIFVFLVKPEIIKQLQGQGMGRHSHQQVNQIGNQNVQALSDFIGNKPFLMGDRPCETDCTVFGMLSQIRWQLPDTDLNQFMTEKCPNLVSYLDRMKEKYWPDWDDCITHGGTRKPVK